MEVLPAGQRQGDRERRSLTDPGIRTHGSSVRFHRFVAWPRSPQSRHRAMNSDLTISVSRSVDAGDHAGPGSSPPRLVC